MKNNEKFCQYCYEIDGTINQKDEEYNRLNEYVEKVQEVIQENFSDFSDFCGKCRSYGKCNRFCCYEQLKEIFEGLE